MKHGSTTTPVSNGLATRSLIVAAAVMMAVSAPVSLMPQVQALSIDQIQAKIDTLKSEQNKYQSTANKLDKKADTLANKINALENQQQSLQAKIDLTQAQYDKLKKQITETKQKIKDNKDALGEIVATMYIDGNTSPLQMLASSKNIGDFVDKHAYQESVNDQLTDTIEQVNELKTQLEDQKQEAELALLTQKKARQNLQDTRAEKQRLLHDTKGKEASYNKMIQKNQAQQDELSRQAAAQMRQTIQSGQANVVSTGGGGGGYPYNCNVTLQWWGGSIVPVSPWVDKGNYGCSQCVSYAAWMLGQQQGKYPSGWGDAYMFANTAASGAGYNAGFRVTDSPRANAVVYFPPGVNGAGGVGHVGWVTGASGNTVTVSQYNYNVSGRADGWGKHNVVNFPHVGGMKYIYVQGH